MISLRLCARQTLGECLYRMGLQQPLPSSLSVLMYHAVTERLLKDPAQQSISAKQFDTHMAGLREWGVDVVSLEEGIQRIARDLNGQPAVSIVFDDGYVGVHDFALDSLIRYRIPATLFLVTDYIGRSQFPWAPPGLGRPLHWEEVATLVNKAGCSVGSHTHSHSLLTYLNLQAVREELRASRDAIQSHLGLTPRVFAYPFGTYGTFNRQTRQALLEEGFSVACTTVWGRYRYGDDPLTVRRIRVSWCDTVHEIRKSLSGCYDWYRIAQRFQAMKRNLTQAGVVKL